MLMNVPNMSRLKFVLHKELGALEKGRQELLQRLSDLGAKMENPVRDDAERASNCSRCQPDMQGPSCAHCDGEELLQAYKNKLFFLKVAGAGAVAVSAEDALIAQHATMLALLSSAKMQRVQDLELQIWWSGQHCYRDKKR